MAKYTAKLLDYSTLLLKDQIEAFCFMYLDPDPAIQYARTGSHLAENSVANSMTTSQPARVNIPCRVGHH